MDETRKWRYIFAESDGLLFYHPHVREPSLCRFLPAQHPHTHAHEYTGKKRRITFVECGNDINSMIDLAKVADLVLLLIDASFGFEMETFEFLNICQVHGMPRIMVSIVSS